MNYKKIIPYILAGIILVTFAFCKGKSIGGRNTAIKAMQDSLVEVRNEKAILSKQRDSIGILLKAASVKSDSTRTIYVNVKNETKIKGDSAYDSTGKFIQVLDKRIVNRIVSDEKHIVNLESELLVAKSMIRVDTLFITKTEKESALNEHIARMVKGLAVSDGLQVGVGYCQSLSGGTPCVYVGYGFSLRR